MRGDLMFPGYELLLEYGKEIISALVGFGIKWWLDRKKAQELKAALEDQFKKTMDELVLQAQAAAGKQAVAEAELGRKLIDIHHLQRQVDEGDKYLKEQQAKLDALVNQLSNKDAHVWLHTRDTKQPYTDYNARVARSPVKLGGPPRPAIVTLVNYKGGVGKTTTTGNLAAYFDNELKKRVLLLDLDYQGSLTTMLQSETGLSKRVGPGVGALLDSGASLAALNGSTEGLGAKLPRSSIVRSFYDFARLEDAKMLEWLLDRANDDLRYRLAKILLDDELGNKFDIVLIDAPPRLTTATVNALCASTHILVPTIVTPISVEPVVNFLQETRALLTKLNPMCRILGVVETMTPPTTHTKDNHVAARASLERSLAISNTPILKSDIARKPVLANGGLAYLTDVDIAATFKKLGTELLRKDNIGALP